MHIPCIKLAARMQTYTHSIEDELHPFYLSAANFSQLKRKKNGKLVAICHDCLLRVTNMQNTTDALLVHSVFNPKCSFVLREMDLEDIVFNCEITDLKQLLKKHFYLFDKIVRQNPELFQEWIDVTV